MWSIGLISMTHSARSDCNIWLQEKHKTLYIITLQTALYCIFLSGLLVSMLSLSLSFLGNVHNRLNQSIAKAISPPSGTKAYYSTHNYTQKSEKQPEAHLFWSRIPAPAPHLRDHCLSSPFENKCGSNFHGNGSGSKYHNFSLIETHSTPCLICFEGSDE